VEKQFRVNGNFAKKPTTAVPYTYETGPFKCEHCKKWGGRTADGLTQHLYKSPCGGSPASPAPVLADSPPGRASPPFSREVRIIRMVEAAVDTCLMRTLQAGGAKHLKVQKAMKAGAAAMLQMIGDLEVPVTINSWSNGKVDLIIAGCVAFEVPPSLQAPPNSQPSNPLKHRPDLGLMV